MKSIYGRLPAFRAPGHRSGILVALALVLAVAATAAAVAGCGGSGGTPAAGQGAGATSIQVLTPVQRGDLVESAMGSVKLVIAKGKTTTVAMVPQQSAASVAVGQTASLMFFRARANGQGGMPFGQGGQGAPSPSPGMNDRGAQGGMPFGQGGSGQGGRPFGQGRFRGRTTPGTVTAVKTNADGSAAVTIAVKKLPANVTAKSVGFASIQTKVLAANVVIIPTAAIKGSGSSATVQVLAGGKTSTRTVVVGKQAGAESEIVSGLSIGENIVWERSFQRGGFFRNGNSPFPGQSAPASGGGFQ
jgi:hypothetical protein